MAARTHFFVSAISSSTADASHGLGWLDDGAGRLEITYALYGDSDLSSGVDFSDLLTLAKNYGQTSGAIWATGDTNYDGAVGFDDLLALAKNYGGTLPGKPSEILKQHVWVAPFPEEDVVGLAGTIGSDRVLMGSDWPHAESVPRPREYVECLDGMTDPQKQAIMRDNLAELIPA